MYFVRVIQRSVTTTQLLVWICNLSEHRVCFNRQTQSNQIVVVYFWTIGTMEVILQGPWRTHNFKKLKLSSFFGLNWPDCLLTLLLLPVCANMLLFATSAPAGNTCSRGPADFYIQAWTWCPSQTTPGAAVVVPAVPQRESKRHYGKRICAAVDIYTKLRARGSVCFGTSTHPTSTTQ